MPFSENGYANSIFFHWVQGQDIYKSKQVRDKQIVRILGKVLFYLLMVCFLNVSVYKLRD